MADQHPTVLEVRDLTKTFYGTVANDHVSFELRAGEVHGLLGENGAGKSTLCSILAGLYKPDAGEIVLWGEPVQFRSPQEASKLGIGMVYQHFRLVPSFTVAENMILGLKNIHRRFSMKAVESTVRELAEEYGLDVSPDAYIWQLSVGEQQRVEILKQLYRGAGIMILDEPTAVLAPQECDALFGVVERMIQHGQAVVLVSHKMDEIIANTKRVTVLRHGRNVGTTLTSETDGSELARMMIGSDHAPETSRPRSREVGERPVLRVVDLEVMSDRRSRAVRGATLEVLPGQVVGVAGVAGNGQRELQEAIAGLRPIESGSVFIGERDVTSSGPRARSNAGLAYVPEDRLGTGLASGLPLEENLVLKSYNRAPHSRSGVLSKSAIDETSRRLTERFDIRGARAGMRVSLMSGGNLQKAILARELTQDHLVLLAASPSRGLDMASTAAVRSHILSETDKGSAVLLFSEDLGEITEMSDVILVMSNGQIVGSYTPDNLDLEELGLLMTGSGL